MAPVPTNTVDAAAASSPSASRDGRDSSAPVSTCSSSSSTTKASPATSETADKTVDTVTHSPEVEEEEEPADDDSDIDTMPRFLSKSSKSKSRRTHSPVDSSRSSTSVGFDRELFGKLEEVTSELDRISRLSDALPQNREIEVVQGELKRVERNSCLMIQSQRELLDKIERHERSSFRRYFVFNRELKVESLKSKLWERMSESASLDRELQHLERKSDSLLESRRTFSGRGSVADQLEAAELSWRMEELEKERQDIVGNLLNAIPVQETQQLSTRIAMYVSEMRASESIQKQVERCWAMYRDALRNLQTALSILLSPSYSGTLKEFVTGPYLMAVEAGHHIEAASHVLQPEARRRYRRYAPDLLSVRPPKFPQAIVDFAKRARVNYDRKSSLSVEGTRKIHAAENVVVMMHRITIQKLELINNWRVEVEQDVARASEAHRRAEAKLQQEMSLLARAVSS